MADATASPAPSIVRRAATAVAGGVSTAASTVATIAVGLIPSYNAIISAVVGAAAMWGGMAIKAHYEPKLVLAAADAPRAAPTPLSCEQAAHNVESKLNEILSRLPPSIKGRVGK